MTAVHLRHEHDTQSQFLADVPFDKLDTLIPTLNAWGLNGEEPNYYGQFVLADTAAYFELVVIDDGGA